MAGLTIRARPGYIFSLNGEWNNVDLAEGEYLDKYWTPRAPILLGVHNRLDYESASVWLSVDDVRRIIAALQAAIDEAAPHQERDE